MQVDDLLYIYYVYLYLREDGTPYYVGKGSGNRAYNRGKHDVKPLKDRSNIRIIAVKLSNAEASLLEKKLIKFYGRKDLNTGILRNQTDGGDGTPGAKRSDAHKAAIAESNRKRTGIQKHSEEWKAANSERMKGNQHGVGKLHTEEWKQANSERMKGNNHASNNKLIIKGELR